MFKLFVVSLLLKIKFNFKKLISMDNGFFILVFVFWIGGAVIAGHIAEDKRCGSAGAVIASLILSPIMGILMAIGSPDKKAYEQRRRIIELLERQNEKTEN